MPRIKALWKVSVELTLTEEQTEAQSNGSYGTKSVPADAHSEDQ